MTTNFDKDFLSHLLIGRQTSFEQYDKAILTLSSGGLALSLAFLRDIVKTPGTYDYWLLITSWILFAVAIVTTVGSFVTSQIAFDYQIDIEKKKRKPPNRYASATKYLNWFSGASFLSAVIITIIFASINLPKGDNTMTDKKSNDREIRGITPPTLQHEEPDRGPIEEGIIPPEKPERTPEEPMPSDSHNGGESNQSSDIESQ